jgi:DeoR family transcriptional regulator, aga operon transcriptional repressor
MSQRAPHRLLVEERRRRILDLVRTRERLTVSELVKQFGVSAVTVRGDLDALASNGEVVRSHGGAIKVRESFPDVPLNVKETLRHAEKVRIGHAAAQLIRDDEIIILDSGTTTAEIARHIKFLKLKSLTVVTNALNIGLELANLPHVRIVMVGGLLRHTSYSTVGPHAEQTLRGLNADRLFLGVDALDPEIGVSTPDLLEAQVNRLMIKVSREVTAVVDSSKFMRRSLSIIAEMSAIHRVITDDNADPGTVEEFRARNIEVVLV